MRTGFLAAAAIGMALLFCAAARADSSESRGGHAVVAPPPDPTFIPSRAIGRTHDCMAFNPTAEPGAYGDVLLQFDVGADGAISNVTLLKSSGSQNVDDAALTCVRQVWRNAPATRNGIPIPTQGHKAIIRFDNGPPP